VKRITGNSESMSIILISDSLLTANDSACGIYFSTVKVEISAPVVDCGMYNSQQNIVGSIY
jgi:hypothetical protein